MGGEEKIKPLQIIIIYTPTFHKNIWIAYFTSEYVTITVLIVYHNQFGKLALLVKIYGYC